MPSAQEPQHQPSLLPDQPAGADRGPSAQQSTRQELSELLRSRRERLQPTDVGLPVASRRQRRTPGLRREEVARLAAISPTYYTFLEQGRDVRPSQQVIESLAQALRLSDTERVYLYQLARVGPPTDSIPTTEELPPVVAGLVARLDPYPTYVTGRRWDVLAANRAARALHADWAVLPAQDRNMVWWRFTAPEARTIYVDWEAEAKALLARFRSAAARHSHDPEFRDLIDRLHQASPEVREWWPGHEVLPLGGGGLKRLRHPTLGEFAFQHTVLQVAERPDQKLVTFSPTADGDYERLTQLAASIDEGAVAGRTENEL